MSRVGTHPALLTSIVGSAIGAGGFGGALGAAPDSARLGFSLLALCIGAIVTIAGALILGGEA